MKNKVLLTLCLVSNYTQCAQNQPEQRLVEVIGNYPNAEVQSYNFNTLPLQFPGFVNEGLGTLRPFIMIRYLENFSSQAFPEDLIEILKTPQYTNEKRAFIKLLINNCPVERSKDLSRYLVENFIKN